MVKDRCLLCLLFYFDSVLNLDNGFLCLTLGALGDREERHWEGMYLCVKACASSMLLWLR